MSYRALIFLLEMSIWPVAYRCIPSIEEIWTVLPEMNCAAALLALDVLLFLILFSSLQHFYVVRNFIYLSNSSAGTFRLSFAMTPLIVCRSLRLASEAALNLSA